MREWLYIRLCGFVEIELIGKLVSLYILFFCCDHLWEPKIPHRSISSPFCVFAPKQTLFMGTETTSSRVGHLLICLYDYPLGQCPLGLLNPGSALSRVSQVKASLISTQLPPAFISTSVALPPYSKHIFPLVSQLKSIKVKPGVAHLYSQHLGDRDRKILG